MDHVAPYRALQKGEMLNWYRIEKILGRGGFGVIYLATDTNLELQVAIKEYIPTDIARRDDDSTVRPITEEHGDMYRWGLDRFIKEARNLVRFKHPNIVRVMSVFQENNTAYMVMEFEEGEDLRGHLKRVGTTTEAALKKLVGPLSEGLSEVHRHGFIHRDIKPANILVRKDGTPVLLDFGSARNASKSGPDGLTALVTVGYAPLEQYASENDEQQGPWTDIYALGGVLYYAISGNDPIDCTKRGTALFNGGRDPLSPAAIIGKEHYSQAFLNAVDWSLKLRIADRPQTLVDWMPALIGDVVVGPTESLDPEYGNGDLTDTILYTPRDGSSDRDSRRGDSRRAESGRADSRRAESGRAESGRAESGRAESGRVSGRRGDSDDRLTLSGVSRRRNKQGFAATGAEDVQRPVPAALFDSQQRTVVKPRPTRKRGRKKLSKGWMLVAAVMPLAAGLMVIYQRQANVSDAGVLATESVGVETPSSIRVEPTAAADAAAQAKAAAARREQARRDTEEAFRARQAAERNAAAERALASDARDADASTLRNGVGTSDTAGTVNSESDSGADSVKRAKSDATNSGTDTIADLDAGVKTGTDARTSGSVDTSASTANGSAKDESTASPKAEQQSELPGDTSPTEVAVQTPSTSPKDSASEELIVATADNGLAASGAAEIAVAADAESAVERASRAIQQAEAKRLAEEARAAAAARTARAKREADRRSSFDGALGKAATALEEGRLDEAGKQIELASATGLSNNTLTALVKRLNNSVMDARRPVSDDDFDSVMTRFDDLRRAIEKKDRPTMNKLVVGDSQSQLFDQLLERFERLDIEISDIRVRNADKSISATLGIRQMVRSNGDVATPSEAYRERIITSQRVNGEWSAIRW